MTKTYTKRTPEQMIADLEAEIAAVRARAAAKAAAQEAKSTPEGVAFLAAVKAIDKATRVATEPRHRELVQALEAARAALAPSIVSLGLRIPEKTKRARKRKGQAA